MNSADLPASDPAAFRIVCPGCAKPLHVPPDAVGKPANCPHCRAAFFLPANADGSPGTPEIGQRFARIGGVPRVLAGPGLALLVVSLAGVIVNGFLTLQFSARPGADLEFARNRVRELRSSGDAEDLRKAAQKKKDAPPDDPAAKAAAERLEDAQDEALAAAWAPWMKPLHAVSLGISAVAAVGAFCVLRGRFYPLALLGCVAAAVNVNHLCCVPGTLAAAWTFLALIQDDARAHFRRAG